MSDLVDRAKAAAGRVEPRWTPERVVAVEHAMARRGRRRTASRRLFWGGAVLTALAFAAWVGRGPSKLTTPEAVTFLDGSLAVPTRADSALRVVDQTAEAMISNLDRGAFRFSVVKDKRRTFQVRVGRVRVEVLGTEFTVDRVDSDRARVVVRTGRVRVFWNGQQAELTDGDEDTFPRPDPQQAPATSDDQRSPEQAVVVPRGAGTTGREKTSWQQLARAEDYDRAFVALEHTKLATEGPAELMLAADVARLSHHPEKALAPLQLLSTKYANDPRAPLAAFTLGRVLLDDLGRPREAGRAFSRAIELAPNGPLVEDIIAREVEAWSRAGDLLRARARAEEYLARFPRGTRVRSVRQFGGLD